MELLKIENKPWYYIRFGLGIIFIIAGFQFFFTEISDSGIINYLFLFTYLLTGLSFMTNDFGMSKSYLKPENNRLIIKLMSKLRPTIIEDSEIEIIILKRSEVTLNLKNGKSISFNLKIVNKDEKSKIYHFFMDYSKERQIKLERIISK